MLAKTTEVEIVEEAVRDGSDVYVEIHLRNVIGER